MDTTTYRGRTLDEVLPKIRAELGPDAIVLRRREGLAGGIGGFFQKSYVEVEARPALEDDQPASPAVTGEIALEARNDRATAEGLASPAIQALVDSAAPFADALARAEGTVSERAHDVLLAAARGEAATAVEPGLYGPQPNHAAIEDAAPAAPPGQAAAAPGHAVAASDHDFAASGHAVAASGHDFAAPGHAFTADPVVPAAGGSPAVRDDLEAGPRPGPGPAAPAAAAAAEQRLVASGLSATLAADVVGEAVAHGLPFAQPRALKKLIRTTLARRLPLMADLGPGPRTLAFVGAGGAGKSAAAERLAVAYAQADAEVVVVALRAADGGCGMAARLEPLGVSVIAAADAEQAARRLARREAALTIVDTPSAGPGDRAAIAQLAADLRALGVGEVHLTLPATLSAAAADELAAALAPLALTHVALTHTDQTARPGAPVELAVSGRRSLSYVCTRETIAPADPEALAKQLLP